METPLLEYPIVQHAYVVPDLDEGIQNWVKNLGAGPFFVMRDFLGQDLRYRGIPSSTRVNYAFGQCGPTQIQLISQDEDAPSIYRDMFDQGRGGFHHVCALVPMTEWERQVKRFVDAGHEVAGSLVTSVPAVYFDCRDTIGFFVELYGRSERSEEFFSMVRSAHENWDGFSEPIRNRVQVLPTTDHMER